MRRLFCLFGFHRHGRVRESGRRLRSSCIDCQIGLVQDHMRQWVTLEQDARVEMRRQELRAQATARATARQRPRMRP
ncbi:hypothetical protein [Flavisphingomonas formosensis]|uniref:hypothetical protein n=1 Tax=Flavisphingomonas formosensis TaxID=861534 RepID=UPI0012FB4115|nr:hypothetical protein [Sphingomonas formosensis]